MCVATAVNVSVMPMVMFVDEKGNVREGGVAPGTLFVTVTVKLVLAWLAVPRLVTLTVKVTVCVWVGSQKKTPLLVVMVASVLGGTEVRLKLSRLGGMFGSVTEVWIRI